MIPRHHGGVVPGHASRTPRGMVIRNSWIQDGIEFADSSVDIQESVLDTDETAIDAERSKLNIKNTHFGPSIPGRTHSPDPPSDRRGESVLFDKVPKWKGEKADESGNYAKGDALFHAQEKAAPRSR